MEKKQEEKARQMKELKDRAEHLQHENDRLRAQVEKKHDLGERDVQDNGLARHLTAHDKGKEPIIPKDVDTLADDELSLGGSPNLSTVKSSRARSRQRHMALHSAMLIMTHSVGQEENPVESVTD